METTEENPSQILEKLKEEIQKLKIEARLSDLKMLPLKIQEAEIYSLKEGNIGSHHKKLLIILKKLSKKLEELERFQNSFQENEYENKIQKLLNESEIYEEERMLQGIKERMTDIQHSDIEPELKEIFLSQINMIKECSFLILSKKKEEKIKIESEIRETQEKIKQITIKCKIPNWQELIKCDTKALETKIKNLQDDLIKEKEKENKNKIKINNYSSTLDGLNSLLNIINGLNEIQKKNITIDQQINDMLEIQKMIAFGLKIALETCDTKSKLTAKTISDHNFIVCKKNEETKSEAVTQYPQSFESKLKADVVKMKHLQKTNAKIPDCAEKSINQLILDLYYKNLNKSTFKSNFLCFINQLKSEFRLTDIEVKKDLTQIENSFEANQYDSAIFSLAKLKKKFINKIDVFEIERLLKKNKNNGALLAEKEIVVFFGLTGVGKSTTILYLAGEKMVEKTTYENGKPIKYIDSNREVPGISVGYEATSKTRYLNFIEVNVSRAIDEKLILCDTCGFEDTEGAEVDISNTIGMINAIKKAHKVKFVVILSEKSIGDRYQGVFSLFETLIRFIPNIDKRLHNFCFLFSKFSNLDDFVNLPGKLKNCVSLIENTDKTKRVLFEKVIIDAEKTYQNRYTNKIDLLDNNPERIMHMIKNELVFIEEPEEAFNATISPSSLSRVNEQSALLYKQVINSETRKAYLSIDYLLKRLRFLSNLTEISKTASSEYDKCKRYIIELLQKTYSSETEKLIQFLKEEKKLNQLNLDTFNNLFPKSEDYFKFLESHFQKEKNAMHIEHFLFLILESLKALLAKKNEKSLFQDQGLHCNLNNIKLLKENFSNIFQEIYESKITEIKEIFKNKKNEIQTIFEGNKKEKVDKFVENFQEFSQICDLYSDLIPDCSSLLCDLKDFLCSTIKNSNANIDKILNINMQKNIENLNNEINFQKTIRFNENLTTAFKNHQKFSEINNATTVLFHNYFQKIQTNIHDIFDKNHNSDNLFILLEMDLNIIKEMDVYEIANVFKSDQLRNQYEDILRTLRNSIEKLNNTIDQNLTNIDKNLSIDKDELVFAIEVYDNSKWLEVFIPDMYRMSSLKIMKSISSSAQRLSKAIITSRSLVRKIDGILINFFSLMKCKNLLEERSKKIGFDQNCSEKTLNSINRAIEFVATELNKKIEKTSKIYGFNQQEGEIGKNGFNEIQSLSYFKLEYEFLLKIFLNFKDNFDELTQTFHAQYKLLDDLLKFLYDGVLKYANILEEKIESALINFLDQGKRADQAAEIILSLKMLNAYPNDLSGSEENTENYSDIIKFIKDRVFNEKISKVLNIMVDEMEKNIAAKKFDSLYLNVKIMQSLSDLDALSICKNEITKIGNKYYQKYLDNSPKIENILNNFNFKFLLGHFKVHANKNDFYDGIQQSIQNLIEITENQFNMFRKLTLIPNFKHLAQVSSTKSCDKDSHKILTIIQKQKEILEQTENLFLDEEMPPTSNRSFNDQNDDIYTIMKKSIIEHKKLTRLEEDAIELLKKYFENSLLIKIIENRIKTQTLQPIILEKFVEFQKYILFNKNLILLKESMVLVSFIRSEFPEESELCGKMKEFENLESKIKNEICDKITSLKIDDPIEIIEKLFFGKFEIEKVLQNLQNPIFLNDITEKFKSYFIDRLKEILNRNDFDKIVKELNSIKSLLQKFINAGIDLKEVNATLEKNIQSIKFGKKLKTIEGEIDSHINNKSYIELREILKRKNEFSNDEDERVSFENLEEKILDFLTIEIKKKFKN